MKNNFKKIGKIIKNIISIMVLLVLIISLVSVINQKASGDQFPSLFGIGAANVLTGSMEPTIPEGSLIIIKESEQYNIKDIVTYVDTNGKAVTHRVVRFEGDKIVTLGDANHGSEDPAISKSQIIGKVIASVPKLGSFLESLSTPQGITLVAIIGLVLYFIVSILFKEEEKGEKEDESK